MPKSRGICAVAAVMVFAVAAIGHPIVGHAASLGPITVHIDSVVASDTHQGVDPKLAAMGPRLRSLFAYSTYRLVNHQDDQTPIGTELSFDLPGGRILHLQPHQVEGDMIEMEMVLFQGDRPLMTTDLKLRSHGILIIGGPKYDNGMLIISIGADCRCPRPDAGAAAAASSMPPHSAAPAAASAQE